MGCRRITNWDFKVGFGVSFFFGVLNAKEVWRLHVRIGPKKQENMWEYEGRAGNTVKHFLIMVVLFG